ncbi:MAG TPA: fumarylacetoacetate hydrolase family protein [Acidobacteriota bacterium]|nr:fumarylacetoacetate hydrolase family protein [Acidobacteriota bacterium]
MATVRLRGVDDEMPVGKIVCVGANYGKHIAEMGGKADAPPDPILFLKPPTAIVRDRGEIDYPAFSSLLHHELEMVLLIGRGGFAIPADRAIDHVAGIGVGLDLTARDIQSRDREKGRPWAIAKGFNDSAPVSDFIPLKPGLNPDDLRMTLTVNGKLRQQCNTAEMLLSSAELIAAASIYFRFERGDLLFTGTPEGVGPLERGDALKIELEGLVSATFRIKDPGCKLSGT